MNRLLTICLLTTVLCGISSADSVWTETFETDGQGTRYTSNTEFSDGGEDYYGRLSNANTDRGYTGGEGSFWWGGQDHDDATTGDGIAERTNTFNSINVSGYTDLVFNGLFAEERPEASSADDIDSTDYVHVQYQLDGGGWQELLWFENDGVGTGSGNNGTFLIDTDFNGTGDGPEQLETAFADFTVDITGTGNSLDLRVIASVNAGDEDWAMDNLRIEGTSGGGGNSAPVLAAIGNRSTIVSNALNFSVTATDADNDSITLTASNLPPNAVFNPAAASGSVTGQFTWVNAAPTGTYTTTFYAGDGTTNITETITITVSNAPIINVAPVLDPIGSKTVTQGDLLMFQITASDANNDPLTFGITNQPSSSTFTTNATSAHFTWIPPDPPGLYTIRFYVSDGTENDFEDVEITVIERVNPPPELQSIGNKSVEAGQTLTFLVEATNFDGVTPETIILTAGNLPPDATFNSATNSGYVSSLFTWTNASPSGIYTSRFYAADGSTNVFEEITITVTEPPVLMITEVADPAGTGGGNYRFVEIYNAGSSPLLLEGGPWFLSKQVNGGTWSDVPLTGTIQADDTFVIAYNAIQFQEAYGFAPNESSSSVSGNGDDAYFLFQGGDHEDGTLIDIYGKFDTDGSDTAWDYEDSRAVRVSSVLQPNTTWTSSEWVIVSGATTDDMGPGTRFNLPQFQDLNNQVIPLGADLSFDVTATDLLDGDAVTVTATNLPTGATFDGSTFTWNSAAPLGIYEVTFIATDKDGSTEKKIDISVIEQLLMMISEVADPSDEGGDAYRFVELYNAGTGTINLETESWYLSKQVNGGSWSDIELTGTLSPDSTWVIANSAADFQDAYGFAPDQESGSVSGNGDDAYFLFYGGNHADGILVDIYGEFDTDGSGTAWDYENSRAERNPDILTPNTIWTAAEWTLTSGAGTGSMTPGEHGPVPEFEDLNDIFVFLGEDLSLEVTAINTVKTDVITLSATDLPTGASFPQATAADRVSSLLSWASPPEGTYTAAFSAAGEAGTATASITITVSSSAEIDGKFYGWKNDTIVKLDNGQFWRNTGGVGPIVDPARRDPEVTVTTVLMNRRMYMEDIPYTTVEQMEISESRVDSEFTGLHNENIYQLRDGTVWEQISFENIPSSASRVTAWRWTADGDTFIRFVDHDNTHIGTCEVIATAPPTGGPTITEIDGYFRGWSNHRVFVLENGQFWQQITADSTVDTLYRPTATITDYLGTGTMRLYVDGALPPGYVEVRQRADVTRTAIDGIFYGFGQGNIFHMQDGSWWRQTSLDSSASTRNNPEILIWSEGGTDYLEMPDEGRIVSAEQLDVISESTIVSSFRGLRYAHFYSLANGQDWMQISFENVSSDENNPTVMLWSEADTVNLLARDSNNQSIGTCETADPWGDDDKDGVRNIDEMIAGTSLLDRNDFFYIAAIQTDEEGRVVLQWPPVAGRIYTIEWTSSLSQPFQTLETLTDWAQDSWTDTVNPPGSGGFYRIRVQLDN